MNTLIIIGFTCLALHASAKPSGYSGGGHGNRYQHLPLVGSSGIVSNSGAYGPAGFVSKYGAIGPNGEHNSLVNNHLEDRHDNGYGHGQGHLPLVGSSGVVSSSGVHGPVGFVSKHGAIGPNGEHNSLVNNHWEGKGVNGQGHGHLPLVGSSGIISNSGAHGPAGFVSKYGAIGPNGEHNSLVNNHWESRRGNGQGYSHLPLVGSSGVVSSSGVHGPAGFVSKHGAIGPNGEHNSLVNNHWESRRGNGQGYGHLPLVGSSGVVDSSGVHGPAGFVSKHGAIGPNGEHNSLVNNHVENRHGNEYNYGQSSSGGAAGPSGFASIHGSFGPRGEHNSIVNNFWKNSKLPLIGASGIVSSAGVSGPSGFVSKEGAVGPSGEHNSLVSAGHRDTYTENHASHWNSNDDGQWRGDGGHGISNSQSSAGYDGHGSW